MKINVKTKYNLGDRVHYKAHVWKSEPCSIYEGVIERIQVDVLPDQEAVNHVRTQVLYNIEDFTDHSGKSGLFTYECNITDKIETLNVFANLRPFDLEAAKNGAKVVMRDGSPVRVLREEINNKYPVIAIMRDRYDGEETVTLLRADGKFGRIYGDSPYDLFMLVDEQGNYIYQ